MNQRAFLSLACLVLPLACRSQPGPVADPRQTPADRTAATTPAVQAPAGPRSEVALAAGLSFADATTVAAPKDFLRGFAVRPAPGQIHAVVEIPTGTNEKWEVKLDGIMRW